MIDENKIINALKKSFKKEKDKILFPEIEIDSLSKDCFFKNSYIVYDKEKKEIVLYTKFHFLSDKEIENEITILEDKKIYSFKILQVFKEILNKNYKLYISIFKNNTNVINIIKRLQFELEDKMFAFCVENPFFNQKNNISNLYFNDNKCYLFFEIENLDEDSINIICKKNQEHKYIVFFLKKPNLLLNKKKYKVIYSYVSNTKTKQFLSKFNKQIIFDEQKYLIINNLEF